MTRAGKIALLALGAAAALCGLALTGWPQDLLLGARLVPPPVERALPAPAAGAFPHELLERALQAHVDEAGRVDFAGLREDKDLAAYVGLLAAYSPRSHPALFPTREEALAYHLNAYNALVLWGVTRHWPLGSVQEVPSGGLWEMKPGQGFFYSLRFVLGGERVHLYGLENETIRGYKDARIHAAINCASVSCPRLRRDAFRPATLEAQLTAGAAEMVGDPRHLRVDPQGRRVVASSIFDWFRADFEAEAPSLLAWWATHAPSSEQRGALEAAQRDGYAVEFAPYDWGVPPAPAR
jgi:hypothetical protein